MNNSNGNIVSTEAVGEILNILYQYSEYDDGDDIAQGTGFISLVRDDKLGADADQCATGYLHLFNPSSTTFVKHYIATTQASHEGDTSLQCFSAGYFNTTSAIDAIQFKTSSDAIDAGDICLYGIK